MCIFFCTEEVGEFNKEFAGFYLLNLLCGDWGHDPGAVRTLPLTRFPGGWGTGVGSQQRKKAGMEGGHRGSPFPGWGPRACVAL